MVFDALRATTGNMVAATGLSGLLLVSIAESVFFPIPTAFFVTLLVALGSNPVMVTIVATTGSVAGAVVGHYLGKKGGRPVLERVASEKHIRLVESWFQRHGVLAILVAGFSPLPYKVFTIASGVADMNPVHLVLASIPSRLAQFALFAFFGTLIATELPVLARMYGI